MVAYKNKPKQRSASRPRAYAYQYETSPRKLAPEYKTQKPKNAKTRPAQKKAHIPSLPKYNYKPILYITAGFIMLFTICYRNSLINENYTKKENLKSELSEVQKENEQLKVSIESSLNLSSIEKIASEQLGMKKLTNEQKIFVNLEKKDYVEPATEEVLIIKNTSLIDRILDALTKVIK